MPRRRCASAGRLVDIDAQDIESRQNQESGSSDSFIPCCRGSKHAHKPCHPASDTQGEQMAQGLARTKSKCSLSASPRVMSHVCWGGVHCSSRFRFLLKGLSLKAIQTALSPCHGNQRAQKASSHIFSRSKWQMGNLSCCS